MNETAGTGRRGVSVYAGLHRIKRDNVAFTSPAMITAPLL